LHNQIGAAVPTHRRRRWTYLKGSSRRHLPDLLAALGEIDLFVHDSLHTERNVRFEMDEAWRALRPGGVLVADDITSNWGFGSFTRSAAGHQWLVGQHEDRQGMFGVVLKEPGRLV
jgi:predicted O-methyltransferase YrrM